MLESNSTIAYVCAYSENNDGGIFSYRVDTENGEFAELEQNPVEGASFLAIHPDRTHIYVITRVGGGFVRAYRRKDTTGKLTELNRQPSGGNSPCYISVNKTGSYVFVANGSDGTISTFPIRDDGSIGEATQMIEHEGSSVDPNRQQHAHPHSIDTCPNDRFVYVPDLGADLIAIYRMGQMKNKLRLEATQEVGLHDGAGPRHFDFDPDGRYLYLINELDSTIVAYGYDTETGSLSEISKVSTLPEDFNGNNLCADIHIHPSGQWIYGSNRGHNSIAVFAVDEDTGALDPLGHESTHGDWPRNFGIDPRGRYLYVLNRRSNSIATFSINRESGELTFEQKLDSLPEPVCIRFLPNRS